MSKDISKKKKEASNESDLSIMNEYDHTTDSIFLIKLTYTTQAKDQSIQSNI